MEYRKISELKKLPNNPRAIKSDDFDKLCTSIQNNPELDLSYMEDEIQN